MQQGISAKFTKAAGESSAYSPSISDCLGIFYARGQEAHGSGMHFILIRGSGTRLSAGKRIIYGQRDSVAAGLLQESDRKFPWTEMFNGDIKVYTHKS